MDRMSKFIAALALSSWTALAAAGEPAGRAFATWNPQDANPALTFSADYLTAIGGAAEWSGVRATIAVDTGTWYWETTYTYAGAADAQTGLAYTNWSLYDAPGAFGSVARAAGVNRAGEIRVSGEVLANIDVVLSTTTVRHLLDADSGNYMIANGAGPWVSADAFPGFFGRTPQYPIASVRAPNGTVQVTANFGATPFVYDVPTGANPGIYTDDALLQDGFDTLAE